MSVLDLILLAAILIGIWNGYARGLIGGLSRLFAYLAAIALASRVATPVGEKIAEWLHLKEAVVEMLTAQVPGSIGQMKVTAEQVEPILRRLSLPEGYRAEVLAELPRQTLLEALAVPYVKLIAMILGLVLVATFCYVLINAVAQPLVRKVTSVMPGFPNAFGGLLLGFAFVLVELSFLAVFLKLVGDMPSLSALLHDPLAASNLVTPLSQLAYAILEGMGSLQRLPLHILSSS